MAERKALTLVEAAELHVIGPCDCRTTVIGCDRNDIQFSCQQSTGILDR